MPISLTSVEDELKSRLASMGGFTSSGAVTKLRYAILRGYQQLANLRDWRWLNQSATITTTSGNLGPYTAPTGLLRFAAARREAFFGFATKDSLVSIAATDTKRYAPYLRVSDAGVMFHDDPGDATLTLNYIAEPNDSIVEADLTATIEIVPSGLRPALVDYAYADLLRWVPAGAGMREQALRDARTAAEDYWHQEFTGLTTQRGIAPRGIQGQSLDGHARIPGLDGR